jgi:secreted trypsin-like serine protease
MKKHKTLPADYPHPFRVLAGCLEWRSKSKQCQERNVTADNYIIHPLYKDWEYDIALVKLEKPFVLSDRVRTICLPPVGSKFQGLATIAGWGKVDDNSNLPSLTLQSAVVSILPFNPFCSIFNESVKSAEGKYCIGFEKRRGLRVGCTGDSGGPLMMKMNERSFVIGITVGGRGCRGENAGVEQRVAEVREWIDETVLKLRAEKTLFQ